MMKRDVLSEEYYDEVCRVIGDAVIVLAEGGSTPIVRCCRICC